MPIEASFQMIQRYNSSGCLVFHQHQHSETDIEICATNYRHPTITSGQHTNGPVSYWVKVQGTDWIRLPRRTSLNEILRDWKEYGKHWFLALREEE